jgi:hypothetical protein
MEQVNTFLLIQLTITTIMKIQSIARSLVLFSTIALAFASTQSSAEAAYYTCYYNNHNYDIGKVVYNNSGPVPYWMICKKDGNGYQARWEKVVRGYS